MCLEDTIGFFDIRRIFGQFESIKQSGIRVTRIMTTLLVMLFYRSRNINSYFSGQYGKQIEKESGKNPYYDMLGNEDVPWRVILYLFARRYLSLISRIADHSKHVIRALIFDDSPLEKTGWKIEGVSKIHDHVTGRYILGFKLLVSGYWDGNSFIPIDFSLHRERGKELDKARHNRNRARRKARKAEAAYLEHKDRHLEKRALLNSLKEELVSASTKGIELEYDKQEKRVSRSKNKQSKLRKQMKQAQFILEEKEEIVRKKEKQSPLYGLSPARQRKQFKKKRDKDSHGHKRRSEADMSKTQSVIRMISRAVKRGFEFEYVLFDSWFFSKEILAHIESFRTKGIKLVAMVKMGRNLYRDCLSGQEMDANTLRKIYKKKGKAQRSRKYNATYIRVPVWYDNRRINLFFVRLGSGSKWKVFITNDLDLTFNKLLEVYHIRWSIEVFYKDAKQHLQLGKCQCNNFDSQIGAATLVMMQYIMLLLYKQRYYGQSLGSIFDLLSTQAQEENITRYLMDIFWEIAHGIGEILKVDIMELFEEIIRDHQKAEEITRLFLPAFERNRAA
ncbi:MAG: transposase [Bacteroidales bacterium]|nr:transposase [Bacteroidales bacterium]